MRSRPAPSHLIRLAVSACILAITSLCLAVPSHAQAKYTITDFGNISVFPTGINASGVTVGNGGLQGWLLAPPYSSLTHITYGWVFGINASGQVTGGSGENTLTGFVSSPPYTTLTDLGTLGGSGSTVGQAINNAGQVTGLFVDASSFNACVPHFAAVHQHDGYGNCRNGLRNQ